MRECTISFLEEFRFNKRRLQSIGCRLGLPTYHLWPTGVIPSLLHKTQDLFPHQPILHSQTFPVALSHTSNPVLATLNYYQQAVEDTRSQKFVLFCLAGCPFLPRLLDIYSSSICSSKVNFLEGFPDFGRWYWPIVLYCLFHIIIILLYSSIIAPVSVLCTYLSSWLFPSTRQWTSWKQEPYPTHFHMPVSGSG